MKFILKNLPIITILLLAIFIRLYKLNDLMVFIGDQGWFYLSARDMITEGDFPLVGITASHTWLHQGALWTYMLTPTLWLFSFNPIGPAYLSIAVGIITVGALYYIGKIMFKDERVGLFAALLYSTSPLAIIHDRAPYHTAPIPLITILFICFLYKFVTGKIRYLPLAAFMLGVLYNLELSTVVFWILFLAIFFYKKNFQPRIVILSLISFLIPMLPMIIYDVRQETGFFQTTAFFRLIKLSVESSSTFSFETISNIFIHLFTYNQRLVFLGNGFIALLITFGGVAFFFRTLYGTYKQKKKDFASVLLSLWIGISLAGIIISQTASEAYLPMLFPGLIFLFAFSIKRIIQREAALVLLVFLISFLNIGTLLSTDYLMIRPYKFGLADRTRASKAILKIADGQKYNLVFRGPGGEFESSTANYEYLTWWLGKNQPTKQKVSRKILVEEKEYKIIVKLL